MMKTIEIKAKPEEKAAVSQSVVRQMYELLGGNMTEIVECASGDWRSDSEFSNWRRGVFLGAVQAHTSHLLLLDDKGVRGFLSYTAPPDTAEIYLNEVQIRPSCQGDGVTLLCLVRSFADRIEQMPHDTLRTYSNKATTRAHSLVEKSGFERVGKTDRGYQYQMPTRAFLMKFGRRRRQNKRVQATR